MSQFMRSAMNGEPIEVYNGGIPSSDLVYVTDVSRLIVAAVQSGDCGVYNAGSGVATSAKELAETVRALFPEQKIEIRIRAPGADLPASFPALTMTKTMPNSRHEPTSLTAAMSNYKRNLEQRA